MCRVSRWRCCLGCNIFAHVSKDSLLLAIIIAKVKATRMKSWCSIPRLLRRFSLLAEKWSRIYAI